MTVSEDEQRQEERLVFAFIGDRISIVDHAADQDLEAIVEELDDPALSPIEQETHEPQLDYGELFSYLSGSVKENDYSANTYARYDAAEHASEDFFKPSFDDSLIDEVIRAKKTKDRYGVEVYINPMKQSLFDGWKQGNMVENHLRYDLIVV